MKQTKFRRVLALILAASFLIGGGAVVSASAEPGDKQTSVSDTSLADVRELLNAASYAEYTSKELFTGADKAKDTITIDAVNYDADSTTTTVYKVKIDKATGKAIIVDDDYVAKDGETIGVFTGESGELALMVDIAEKARYSIAIEYFPMTAVVDAEGKTVFADKSGSIERILKIDNKIPFSEARYIVMSKVWQNVYTIKMSVLSTEAQADGTIKKTYESFEPYVEKAKTCGLEYTVADDGSSITLFLPEGGWTSEQLAKIGEENIRFFTTDIDNNEIRCSMERVPEIRRFRCKDVDGFYSDSFEFVFEQGTRKLSLESKSQGCVITRVILYPQETYSSFDEFDAAQGSKPMGTDTVKIESEFTFATSSQTIYPIEDSSSAATSPSDTTRTILNTIGGEKWQTAGQWIRYNFKVNASGLYNIVPRFRQNVNDGIFSSRILYIYSGEGVNPGEAGYYNGIPFDEATNYRFGYSTDWQTAPLTFARKTYDDKGNTIWTDVATRFYFKEGVTYSLEFEVSLGDMGEIVSSVSTSLSNINSYYLNIIKLTGADPDQYRDYGFYRIMPDTMQGLIVESRRLYNIAAELKDIAGAKSSNVATLEKIAWLLNEMGTDEDNVARYLDQLKSYIGTLGTWINTNKTQPLEFDYISIQGADAPMPKAKANFFESLWHEVCKFWQSFFRNYNRMGATMAETDSSDSVEVWLAKGRDQTQVIRNLINNDFTPETGYPVNLKLVTGSTLLPSILAGSGPDSYIGIGEGNIINYAIRGALINIENFDGFYDLTSQYAVEHFTVDDYIKQLKAENYIIEESGNALRAKSIDDKVMYEIKYSNDNSGTITDKNGKVVYSFSKEGWIYETGESFRGNTYKYKDVYDEDGNKVLNKNAQFNEAAMFVLGMPDADNVMHYYGLPEEQHFSMMFVRNDILADLGIDIPKTWDDLEKAVPVLQANNMMIGMHNDYKVFTYQNGSKLFADDGMRINLDSNVALKSFDYMCSLYTMYSYPYKYDFSNRFRTGEMPIGIAGYNGTYNQLIVFATEIRGLWSFYPVPGIATYKTDAEGNYVYENGQKVVESINNVAVATVNAISMINGCKNTEAAWEFMKWHVGAECQVNYSNEMVAILGDSAKYATANITALESMPWTTSEYEQLALQFNNLASIPNYPGSYIIGRYTQFAFLAAIDKKANPTDSLQKYINNINKEITRKRAEFDLETLEIGETLAEKRINEARALIKSLDQATKSKYAAEITALNNAIGNLESTKAIVSDEHIQDLRDAAWGLRETQYSTLFEAADLIDSAIEQLVDYQASYR